MTRELALEAASSLRSLKISFFTAEQAAALKEDEMGSLPQDVCEKMRDTLEGAEQFVQGASSAAHWYNLDKVKLNCADAGVQREELIDLTETLGSCLSTIRKISLLGRVKTSDDGKSAK